MSPSPHVLWCFCVFASCLCLGWAWLTCFTHTHLFLIHFMHHPGYKNLISSVILHQFIVSPARGNLWLRTSCDIHDIHLLFFLECLPVDSSSQPCHFLLLYLKPHPASVSTCTLGPVLCWIYLFLIL